MAAAEDTKHRSPEAQTAVKTAATTTMPAVTPEDFKLVEPKKKSKRSLRKTNDRTDLAALRKGQKLTGRVVTLTGFGAFVDAKAKKDILIPIRDLRLFNDEENVADVPFGLQGAWDLLRVGDVVEVSVVRVDVRKKRVSGSLDRIVQSTGQTKPIPKTGCETEFPKLGQASFK